MVQLALSSESLSVLLSEPLSALLLEPLLVLLSELLSALSSLSQLEWLSLSPADLLVTLHWCNDIAVSAYQPEMWQ